MRKIERLRREALTKCKGQGHTMRRFIHAIDMRQSSCMLCGKIADVSGNESCIYGEAVTKRCKPTIAYLAERNAAMGGYYFSRDTLKFFGQRRSDFKVRVVAGRVFVQAASYQTSGCSANSYGRYMGESFAEFNPKTGDLRSVSDVDATKPGVRAFLESIE